jgi:hypothetical protein
MRALVAFSLAALSLGAMGCTALVSSEVPEPPCVLITGYADPCPAGSLCISTETGDERHGTCHTGCGEEMCNGVDDDCDSIIDEDPTYDADGDGYTWCGTRSHGTGIDPGRIDCDDGNANVHPYDSSTMQPQDVCNNVDDDCDGHVDESACPAGEFCSVAHRCYASGDCSVPEAAACGSGTFCDLMATPPSCRAIPPMGCIADPASCGAGMYCNTITNMCEARAPLGAPCTSDSDCASGACFDAAALSYDGTGTGRVCSAPCCADRDCAALGAQVVCRVTAQGARGCVMMAGGDTPGACADNGDCGSGNVCRLFPNVQTGGSSRNRTVCAPGDPVVGSSCDPRCADIPFVGCSLVCDSGECIGDGTSGHCATSCSTSSDCYSGVCISNICRDNCRTSADCPGMRCGYAYRGSDWFQSCLFRSSRATLSAGQSCSSGADCIDGYCNRSGVCSAVCCTDADCGAGVCRPVNNGGWEMRCETRTAGPG